MTPLQILMWRIIWISPAGTNHKEFKSTRATQKKEVPLLAIGAQERVMKQGILATSRDQKNKKTDSLPELKKGMQPTIILLLAQGDPFLTPDLQNLRIRTLF